MCLKRAGSIVPIVPQEKYLSHLPTEGNRALACDGQFVRATHHRSGDSVPVASFMAGADADDRSDCGEQRLSSRAPGNSPISRPLIRAVILAWCVHWLRWSPTFAG
jgi:hypothetical protein